IRSRRELCAVSVLFILYAPVSLCYSTFCADLTVSSDRFSRSPLHLWCPLAYSPGAAHPCIYPGLRSRACHTGAACAGLQLEFRGDLPLELVMNSGSQN